METQTAASIQRKVSASTKLSPLRLLLRAFFVVVVGRVEARAFKADADRLEDLPDWGATLDAFRQRVVGHPLQHVEDVPVLALVFVDWHLLPPRVGYG